MTNGDRNKQNWLQWCHNANRGICPKKKQRTLPEFLSATARVVSIRFCAFVITIIHETIIYHLLM